MKITKFGHSCLLVEEKNARILIDPGEWSVLPEAIPALDAVLVTHEHPDHLGIEHLKKIIPQNPQAVIYTNKGVGAKLTVANIPFQLLEEWQNVVIKGVPIEAYGKDHASIYPGLPHWDNTGYLVGSKLFHPGDSFTVPPQSVEVLALPVCAPWSKISEVIDYAKAVKPKVTFPIHDGMLKINTGFHKWPETFLTPLGIRWEVIAEGKSIEI